MEEEGPGLISIATRDWETEVLSALLVQSPSREGRLEIMLSTMGKPQRVLRLGRNSALQDDPYWQQDNNC